MKAVELGLKINLPKEEAERILLNNGFKCIFKTVTHDVYYAKPGTDFSGMSEYDIKMNCVRVRNDNNFDNLCLIQEDFPVKTKLDGKKAKKVMKMIKSAGYLKVFDTKKTDWIYVKDKISHQLQDIDNIGLLDYVYDESIFGKSEDEQYSYLITHMKNLGIGLENELGVDKLRSLYSGELKYSKNQNGDYYYKDK